MDFYWQLTQKDGTTILIPPEAVERVQHWMSAKEPILLKSAVIPYSEVKGFEATSKAYSNVPLLEEAAAAFKEPIFTEDGSMQARWVKKAVTQREYQNYFSKIPSYHKLDEDGARVWVAFLIAVHDIDHTRVDNCTDAESERLDATRNRRD